MMHQWRGLTRDRDKKAHSNLHCKNQTYFTNSVLNALSVSRLLTDYVEDASMRMCENAKALA